MPDDAVPWLNEATSRIFRPIANLENFKIHLYNFADSRLPIKNLSSYVSMKRLRKHPLTHPFQSCNLITVKLEQGTDYRTHTIIGRLYSRN